MRVLYWGSPPFSIPPLEALLESPHRVVGLVTREDRPAGRGRRLHATEAKRVALERGLPVLQPATPADPAFLDAARALRADISVVAAYGRILRPAALGLPPMGSICIHPSLLPLYRGASPIQRAILAGETVTGVTIIRMDEGMDSGDLLAREPVPIERGERAGALGERLSRISARMLIALLDRMEAGDVPAEPQAHDEATLAPKVEVAEARIDWRKPPRLLELESRAFDPWPGPFTDLDGERVRLFGIREGTDLLASGGTPGEVIDLQRDGPVVRAGDGCVVVTEFQSPGRRRMDAASWLRGKNLRPGSVFGR